MVVNNGVWIGGLEVGRVIKRGKVGDFEGDFVKKMTKAMFIGEFHRMVVEKPVDPSRNDGVFFFI